MYLCNTEQSQGEQFSQPQYRVPALYLCLLKQNAPGYPLLILYNTWKSGKISKNNEDAMKYLSALSAVSSPTELTQKSE